MLALLLIIIIICSSSNPFLQWGAKTLLQPLSLPLPLALLLTWEMNERWWGERERAVTTLPAQQTCRRMQSTWKLLENLSDGAIFKFENKSETNKEKRKKHTKTHWEKPTTTTSPFYVDVDVAACLTECQSQCWLCAAVVVVVVTGAAFIVVVVVYSFLNSLVRVARRFQGDSLVRAGESTCVCVPLSVYVCIAYFRPKQLTWRNIYWIWRRRRQQRIFCCRWGNCFEQSSLLLLQLQINGKFRKFVYYIPPSTHNFMSLTLIAN